MAKARVDIVDELRAHDRSDDAVRFVTPADVWYREQFRRDSTARTCRLQLATALMQIGAWRDVLPLLEAHARARPNNQPPRFAANTAIAAVDPGNTALADEMLARLTASTPLPVCYGDIALMTRWCNHGSSRRCGYRAVSDSARRIAGSNDTGPIGPMTRCRTCPSRPMSTDVGYPRTPPSAAITSFPTMAIG